MRGLSPLILLTLWIATPMGSPAFVRLQHDAMVPAMELTAQNIPTGIRPGAWMSSPRNCTMSWVLSDTLGQVYITTAGHCVMAVGQAVSVRGHGEIGTVVAFENKSPPFGGGDFALVRIHADKVSEVHPSMAGWGGPVGMVTSIPATNLDGRLYGWGRMAWLTEETRCREVEFMSSEWKGDYWEAEGAAASGDSGSPLMTADGLAVGILEGSSLETAIRIPGERVGGYRLDYVIAFLENKTGLDFTIVEGGAPNPQCGN